MSDVKLFLRVLQTEGYPNPNIVSIAKMVGYHLDDFLLDLKHELGDEGVTDFCVRAIDKLQGEDGVRVELSNPEEFCYVHVIPLFFDEDETENDIICQSTWGESRLISTDMETGEETYKTIHEIIEETDFSTWSELDELIEDIQINTSNIVYNNCGFGLWWQ